MTNKDALQLLTDWADTGISHVYHFIQNEAGEDSTKLREAIDQLATTIGIKPHTITTDHIESHAYMETDINERD